MTMYQKGAITSILILSIINLFNYLDRYITSSTKNLIISDLNLTDTQSSIPLTSFIVVYMIFSPIFGSLSDAGYERKKLLAIGVAIWSFATMSTFFANGYLGLVLTRMVVGVGEASYGVIAPSLIADLVHPNERNKALTFFNVAIPFGSALGFVLGGVLGDLFGWRYAFLICGAPGLLLTFLIFKIIDPGRGVYEDEVLKEKNYTFLETIQIWRKNHNYLFAVVGNIFLTFGFGALVDWLPTFLTRKFDVSISEAGMVVGAITVVSGIVGGVTGSILGDWAKKYTKQSYFAVSSIGLLIASAAAVLSFQIENYHQSLFILLLGEIAVWWQTGLINATIANSTDPNVRARSYGMQVLLIHILGDAISPTIVGLISDQTGSLETGLKLVPFSFLLAGITWGIAWRCIPPVNRKISS